MPYKSDKIRIEGTMHDGRVRLNDEQKDEIRNLYKTGKWSQRQLASEYNVSRSLIAIIVNPARAEAVKNRVRDHWKDYSDRKRLTEAVRKTRRKKHDLYLSGEIGLHGIQPTHVIIDDMPYDPKYDDSDMSGPGDPFGLDR